jgi:hypothetical protein
MNVKSILVILITLWIPGTIHPLPIEEIVTYFDPEIPGNSHVFIRHDRFAVFIEPKDFGLESFVITGIWFESGMFGPIGLSLCEDNTTNPDWDHFPGIPFYETIYHASTEIKEDTVTVEDEIERKDSRGVWIVFEYETDGIPFLTSNTNPPPYRNLSRLKSPQLWWSDTEDDWSVGLIVRYDATAGTDPGDNPLILPRSLILYQNTPNPFNPSTTIRFDIAKSCVVNLSVFDARGRLIRNLLNNARKTAGTHQIYWDGTDEEGENIPSGIYFYRLEDGSETRTRKMVLLK